MGCVKSKSENVVNDTVNNKYRSVYVYKTPSHLKLQSMDIPESIELCDTVPFIVPIESGRVIKVFDGDTITIASKICIPDCPIYRFQVRLNGIDCPEITSMNKTEKEIAVIARDKLHEKIFGKWVELRNVNDEKYGRILADVWCKSDTGTLECINEWMIENRLAVRYDGGTKHSPNNWRSYYNYNSA